jgi:hypothetical protein
MAYLGVVNVLLGAVAAQPVPGDFKLLRPVAKGHEAQDPQQDADRLGRHHLHSAHVNRLRVVAQPVAKVDALHVHLAELLARLAGDEQREQRVLNVAVAPVLALDGTHARNVSCTERCRGARPEDEENEAWQPE